MKVIVNEDNLDITLDGPPSYPVIVENPTPSEITVTSPEFIINLEPIPLSVPIVIGIQGPKGVISKTGDVVTRIAGENLSGHRVVAPGLDDKVYYADSLNLSQKNNVLGITTGAIMFNATGSIQTYGIMEELSWNWDMSRAIYLGINGFLTQNITATGFILQLGFPLSETSMFIDIKEPIILV